MRGHISKNKKDIEKIIKKFRKILDENGQSLKWWHKKNIKDCRYDYFIRQINNIELITPGVLKVIENYMPDENI